MAQTVELFDGYTLLQGDDCFPLTTDSVLLADFLWARPGQRGLEMGCGCGGLWVLAALHLPGCQLDGVELEPGPLALARENQARCSLSHRGVLWLGDLRQGAEPRYDFCLCNPPYHRGGAACQDLARQRARNQRHTQLEEVCQAAARWLRAKGSFFFCWPARQLDQAWQALGQAGMAPRRLRFVHHRPGAPAYLALVEARRGAGEQQVLAPLFLQDEEGRETGEYCRIYHRSPRDTEGG